MRKVLKEAIASQRADGSRIGSDERPATLSVSSPDSNGGGSGPALAAPVPGAHTYTAYNSGSRQHTAVALGGDDSDAGPAAPGRRRSNTGPVSARTSGTPFWGCPVKRGKGMSRRASPFPTLVVLCVIFAKRRTACQTGGGSGHIACGGADG